MNDIILARRTRRPVRPPVRSARTMDVVMRKAPAVRPRFVAPRRVQAVDIVIEPERPISLIRPIESLSADEKLSVMARAIEKAQADLRKERRKKPALGALVIVFTSRARAPRR